MKVRDLMIVLAMCLALMTLPAAAAEEGAAVEATETPAETPMQMTAVEEFETPIQRMSYAVGFQWAGFFKRRADNYDVDAFVAGIRDSLTDSRPRLDPSVMEELMDEFFGGDRRRRGRRGRPDPEANLQEAKDFLAENKDKEGVQTLPGGVQYQVIEAGTGASPEADDRVTVHYRGMHLDGEEFDSSYSRGEPSQLDLSNTIPGWRQALTHMKKGAKWKVWIPPELAYGERGVERAIQPNELLVFEITLVQFED